MRAYDELADMLNEIDEGQDWPEQLTGRGRRCLQTTRTSREQYQPIPPSTEKLALLAEQARTTTDSFTGIGEAAPPAPDPGSM